MTNGERDSLGTEHLGEMYVARMRELARAEDDIDRFYIFLHDEKIYAMDEEGGPPWEMIRALYVEWLGEMTRERRKELYRINAAWNGANQNHALWEMLDEEGNIIPE